MYSKSYTLNSKDIALIGMMVAVIEVCKIAFASIPNIELTSFFIIIFSIYFGKRIYVVIPVFTLIEGLIFGFGLWWIMYLYVWPILAFATRRIKNENSAVGYSIISGLFGLMFGFLCSFPYVLTGDSLVNGLKIAFAWWIAGIPWDIVHGVANFFIMLVLYHPVSSVMNKAKRYNS